MNHIFTFSTRYWTNWWHIANFVCLESLDKCNYGQSISPEIVLTTYLHMLLVYIQRFIKTEYSILEWCISSHISESNQNFADKCIIISKPGTFSRVSWFFFENESFFFTDITFFCSCFGLYYDKIFLYRDFIIVKSKTTGEKWISCDGKRLILKKTWVYSLFWFNL